MSVEGFKTGPDTDTNSRYNEIGPDYFRTLGIPLIAGREFTRADGIGAPKVVVVNEAFAKKFNLGRDAVGKHIGNRGADAALDTEIVGLVQDAKYSQVKDAIPPQFFRPYRQGDTPQIGGITFYVKSGGDPNLLLAAVPRVVARLDPNLPIQELPDHAATGARERVPRSLHQRAVGGVRVSGDAARRRRASTVCSPTPCRSARVRSVCAWRSAPLPLACGHGPRQVGLMTIVGGVVGLGAAGAARAARAGAAVPDAGIRPCSCSCGVGDRR